ncbi:MAG: lamin tail domain-containing protein [Nannocystis sp.]|uniref:lamin tail domain-containing protein n=1 Tax=Nannocystis sp. TaxID=1962667 RepID=UPI0024208556|nr:lamin tail domain-containing protein [Nannocystis sp.]MBK9757613.1 lamin tail domain-containing protein [Nannocystis sp.]
MTLDRPLLLSLALGVAACGDNSTATTAGDSTTGTASGTTGDATTNDPTTPPTTGTPTTGDTSSSAGPTSDTPGSTTDAPATTTGDSSTDALTSSTGPITASTGVIDETTSSTGSDASTSGDTTSSTGADSSSTGDTMGVTDDTIYEIQNGTIKEKQPVDVKGVIVTGISATKTGMFVQEKDGGQYSGAWVYVGKMGPNIMALALGDEVDITGSTLEFNDLTEIDASLGTVTPTGVKGVKIDPAPVTLKTLADPITAEPWEAVHIRVTAAPLTITQIINLVEYKLTSAGEGVVIDDLLYASLMDKLSFPQIGVDASFTAAAGPLNQSVGVYKIAPRMPADLEGYKPPPNPKLGVEDLKAGDLVISEVMYNPTCNNDDCEWIEVYNASAQPIDLLGLIIQDDAQDKNKQGKVTVSAIVDPGKFAVLGYKTMVSWPYPNPPAAFYGANPALGNGGDQVFLKNSTITIDGMPAWGNQANNQGHSFKLDPNKLNAVDNDVAGNWCYSSVIFYMNTEWGSPGAANELACAVL